METTLRVVKTVLDHAQGIKGYTLIGAMAMGAWIAPRATMDVDVLVHVPKRSHRIVDHVRSSLISRGWSVALYSHEQKSIPYRLRAQTPKGLMIDLIFAPLAIHKRIVEHSQIAPIGKRLRFPVAGPEGIAVLKLMAGRKQDLIDVERILAEAELDDALLLNFAREAKVKQPLMRAAKRAGWSGG